MPTTATTYAGAVSSGFPTGATWTTATNAVGSGTSTFAVFTTAVNAAVGQILLEGYGFQTLIGPRPGMILSVTAVVATNVATVARWTSATAQLYSGTTPIGSSQSLTLSTTTTNSQTLTFPGPTWAQLADLRIMITGTKSGTQSSTFNVDYASMAVNYVGQPSIFNYEPKRRSTRSR